MREAAQRLSSPVGLPRAAAATAKRRDGKRAPVETPGAASQAAGGAWGEALLLTRCEMPR